MREVEIKVAIDDPKDIESKLETLGVKLGETKKQHDRVFCLPGAEKNPLDANWLRVRIQNDQEVFFTVKRSIVGQLDSLEHEVVVSDPEELCAIIKMLGYEQYSDLIKMRRVGKYKDIEICLDQLPDLGNFIEAEKLLSDDNESHEEIIDELWGLFHELGLSKDNEIHEGYDVLERRLRDERK